MRQKAAENLGQLSVMSARVDALANDLVAQAQAAATGLKESYLTALAGVLAGCGGRLSPATRSAAGQALQNLMAAAGAPPQTLSPKSNPLPTILCVPMSYF